MAEKLVSAVKNFELTIDQLPGLELSEAQQKADIISLEAQLSAIEERRAVALIARAESRKRLEFLIGSVAKSVQSWK